MANVSTDAKALRHLLTRGVGEIAIKEHLQTALASGKALRIKLGIDPTGSELHLGHTVVLRKLKQFQDLGHTIVLIIGDFTAKIGDPTGRSQERAPLTDAQIKQNMKRYLIQAGKVIDVVKAEIVHNSDWFAHEGLADAIELARAGTIQQVLHRADFKKRIDEGNEITLTEALYPILQGYDSVKVEADVELGGTDQTFNLHMGRRVQRHFKMPEQDVVTVPLLEGTDGVKKMSKSAGNYIGLDEAPSEMFGKLMAIPDELIDKYYELLTDISRTTSHPRDAKVALATELVRMYHGEKAAKVAAAEFENVFSAKQTPRDIPLVHVGASTLLLFELLVSAGLAASNSEARRLIEQGGVKVNEVKKTEAHEDISLAQEVLVQVGPRRFVRVVR